MHWLKRIFSPLEQDEGRSIRPDDVFDIKITEFDDIQKLYQARIKELEADNARLRVLLLLKKMNNKYNDAVWIDT